MLHVIRRRPLACAGVAVYSAIAASLPATAQSSPVQPRAVNTPFVVLGFNDLGMHCMNQDCSELLILPPFNNLHAQVIDRTHGSPEIVTNGITVQYVMPSNTRSADKTNFWTYANALLGVNLPPNIGLTGNGLSGPMTRVAGRTDFAATGIPVTPIDDNGRENPYPLATVTVRQNGVIMGTTQAVVPVSWEISCNLCHNAPGVSTATDILEDHDRLHGTTLVNQKPVLCAACHADVALGAPGLPGVSNFSSAMHTAHAPRMAELGLKNECYACHPGIRTLCQRDIHLSRGMSCNDCHVSMLAVGDPGRRPWIDEPLCGSCHQADHPPWEFEEPGKLFKESRGHRGIMCASCHGSPHAITPTITAADNVQAITAQGHAGRIDTCTVCHSEVPSDPFPHRLTDDD
jgi:hypothetical protein